MQAEGIAEADPSLDVDGWDAAAKAAGAGQRADAARGSRRTTVEREGIGPSTAAAARWRRRRAGGVCGSSRRPRGTPAGVRHVVRPVELPADDLLAGLRGMANALVLKTDLLGEIAICQLGGSLTQTAYALLSDLVTIRRRRAAPHAAPLGRIP